MSKTSRRLVIQYAWSREHRDESPCGARAATMAGAYDVHRTWASTIWSIWPTKSLYAFFGCSPAQTCCKEQEKLSESNYKTHNAKNHVKGGHYLPETPHRTHGGEVRWVGAVGQRLVLREVGPRPGQHATVLPTSRRPPD
jgi:hypothetical protein